ncbi:MAG TPA: ATP-binding cassette domain-containing protein [Burkholderiales bacterium]|nr:ATP-binding cassette domain-containing protein [Burkholderiales bacterium]
MLEIDALASGYGDSVVLDGLSLRVGAGEIVAVLGRNGIGKTTLMKTLAGLLGVRHGSVRLDGNDLAALPTASRARLGLGYVPQGREIFPKLSILENLLVGIHAAGLPASRAQAILDDFPALKPKLHDAGASLSGGQQQMLALARALVLQPKLLLLDEPSEGIQPSVLDEIQVTLARVRGKSGLAILLVEQNLDFAAALADRALLMDNGRISREIDPRRLLDDPELFQEFIGTAG